MTVTQALARGTPDALTVPDTDPTGSAEAGAATTRRTASASRADPQDGRGEGDRARARPRMRTPSRTESPPSCAGPRRQASRTSAGPASQGQARALLGDRRDARGKVRDCRVRVIEHRDDATRRGQRPASGSCARSRVDEHVGQMRRPGPEHDLVADGCRPRASSTSAAAAQTSSDVGAGTPARPTPRSHQRRPYPAAATASRPAATSDGSPGGASEPGSAARNPSSTAARRMSDLVRTSRWACAYLARTRSRYSLAVAGLTFIRRATESSFIPDA